MVNKNKLLGKIAEAGKSQRLLAQEVGMSVNTLNSKINGKGSFDIEQVVKICNVLNITESDEKAEIFLN
jgi:transcriptional regulator with XRE-family HTH domain